MKFFVPNLPSAIPQSLHMPLLALLICAGIAGAMATWAIWDVEARRQTLAHLQQALRQSEQALERGRKDHEDAVRGRQILEKLVHHDAVSELENLLSLLPSNANANAKVDQPEADAVNTPQMPWQEYRFRLRTTIAHEGRLLAVLNAWQQRSPMQHKIQQCQISRQPPGLLADCELSYWTLKKAPQS